MKGANLLWLQGCGCTGDTISFLNITQPGIITALESLGIRLVWHPLIRMEEDALHRCIKGDIRVDILCVEGAVPLGPDKTGRYFILKDRPFKDWVIDLAGVAGFTIGIGTCASFGGVVASGSNPTSSCGLQFTRRVKGGLLGKEYRSRSGFEVINIPGCPVHPDWLKETLEACIRGELSKEALDPFNRPKVFYGKLAHHGCPRNEYYEFKASALEYTQCGCMFEYLGCKGTLCESDCNERLWCGRTGSCTRGGFPCIACTSPDFPDAQVPYFETRKMGDIPVTMPRDVPRAWYIGITSLARLATPKRLKDQATSSPGRC
jgi:NiFe hydrogenase small subunit HydA